MDPTRFPQVEVRSEAQLWDWLGRHHAQTGSVWLVTWKAAHRDRYVSREAVLDALIAHGWIDGRRMKLDPDRTMQLISPRRQLAWTETYKTRAARLQGEGRMHPAGLAALAAGRASGLWQTSAPIDALEDPEDLLAALDVSGGAGWWRQAASSYRRNILRWIATAKRPQTRTRRITTVADHAAKGQKVPHY